MISLKNFSEMASVGLCVRDNVVFTPYFKSTFFLGLDGHKFSSVDGSDTLWCRLCDFHTFDMLTSLQNIVHIILCRTRAWTFVVFCKLSTIVKLHWVDLPVYWHSYQQLLDLQLKSIGVTFPNRFRCSIVRMRFYWSCWRSTPVAFFGTSIVWVWEL